MRGLCDRKIVCGTAVGCSIKVGNPGRFAGGRGSCNFPTSPLRLADAEGNSVLVFPTISLRISEIESRGPYRYRSFSLEIRIASKPGLPVVRSTVPCVPPSLPPRVTCFHVSMEETVAGNLCPAFLLFPMIPVTSRYRDQLSKTLIIYCPFSYARIESLMTLLLEIGRREFGR